LIHSRALVIAGLLLAIVAHWARVDAQQVPRAVKIGFLNANPPAAAAVLVEAFRQGWRELDYVEGKTFVCSFNPLKCPALQTSIAPSRP
jgi:hypothetical protein